MWDDNNSFGPICQLRGQIRSEPHIVHVYGFRVKQLGIIFIYFLCVIMYKKSVGKESVRFQILFYFIFLYAA